MVNEKLQKKNKAEKDFERNHSDQIWKKNNIKLGNHGTL